MKARVNEHQGCYSIDLEAEDMKDAALLVRMARNATKEIRSASTCPLEDGQFWFSLTMGRRRRGRSGIQIGGKT